LLLPRRRASSLGRYPSIDRFFRARHRNDKDRNSSKLAAPVCSLNCPEPPQQAPIFLGFAWHNFCCPGPAKPSEGQSIMERILTASDVAALLKVHLKTVYRLARKGSLPGKKFGGGWRFSKDEIMSLITHRSSEPKRFGGR
jgi:excisionase family DNA binding protein